MSVLKLFCLLAAFLLLATVTFGAPAKPSPEAAIFCALARTNAFTVYHAEWRDESRSRDVPVTIYFPVVKSVAAKPLPMIIFSHGLGGSRDGYDYLGRYWAAHGFISVHIQHLGTDTGIWLDILDGRPLGAMQRAVENLPNLINRPLDASFAITRMLALNRDRGSPFYGRISATNIGMAGHSLGAFTTLALAGQAFPPYGGKTYFFGDPRIKAAIPMSSSVPTDRTQLDKTYAQIRIPCLHMTGTLDDSPLGETTADERRVPFDHSKRSDQFLLTFNGADHMTFAGLNSPLFSGPNDEAFQHWICVSSTVFWNAYLRDQISSRTWLAKNLQTDLGTIGQLEVRLKKQ